MYNTILFGYSEQQLPEAELENEADLFYYQMSNDLQEQEQDKMPQLADNIVMGCY